MRLLALPRATTCVRHCLLESLRRLPSVQPRCRHPHRGLHVLEPRLRAPDPRVRRPLATSPVAPLSALGCVRPALLESPLERLAALRQIRRVSQKVEESAAANVDKRRRRQEARERWGATKWGSVEQRSKRVAVFSFGAEGRREMDPEVEKLLAPMRALVKEQGDAVRRLKAEGASEIDVKKAVAELKTRKKALEDKELELTPAEATFDRAKMEDLLKRRFFYDQSFAIYGGVSGQYDFGPMGCAMKVNILNAWRSFFVEEEEMLEVDCTMLTPEPVLKASGHVDKFADLMVKDAKNGECFRLDHLIKAHLEKVRGLKATKQETKERIDDVLVKLDNFGAEEMAAIMKEFDMKSPLTGNELSAPMEFNLMFQTHIGPTGTVKGFLRPETAQGIFVNFKRLLEFNQSKLPFAAAQIGNAFRNEISPRSGLLRVREFTMAEIEHFCDPSDKNHPKFDDVRNVEVLLYSACNQMDGKPVYRTTIGEAVEGSSRHFGDLSSAPLLRRLSRLLDDRPFVAGFAAPSAADAVVLRRLEEQRSWATQCARSLPSVARWIRAMHTYAAAERDSWESPWPDVPRDQLSVELIAQKICGGSAEGLKGTIANQTLGYFMARIQVFLTAIGADPRRLRFRQHMSNEMAHYACDCWDAELLTSYGWVECVGCADRSAYDLSQHTKATGVDMTAEKDLPEPRIDDVVELQPAKGPIGKAFKKEAGALIAHLASLKVSEVERIEGELAGDGKSQVETADGAKFELTKEMVVGVKRYQKKVLVEEIVPSVIEPSFGIGRIMYAIFEHNFDIRENDEQRRYFKLPPIIAPYKCSILPISNKPEFDPIVKELFKSLTRAGVSRKVDTSRGSIGRRYTRWDEVGTPFAVCVDFDSLKEPQTVTLRERNTLTQVRMPVEDVAPVVRALSQDEMTWAEVAQKYPKFEQQESTK